MKQQDHASQSLDQITGMYPVGGLMKQRLNPHSSKLNFKEKKDLEKKEKNSKYLGRQFEKSEEKYLKILLHSSIADQQSYGGMIQFCLESFKVKFVLSKYTLGGVL